jgi:quercetin dioxygenase-like cupin family protein
MNVVGALQAARDAVAANPSRPATAILHDSPGARLVVFRLAPGQFVPPHRSSSTVTIHVLAGSGHLSGEHDGEEVAHEVSAGDIALYAPSELHGMRADDVELLLLATISPRPGGR